MARLTIKTRFLIISDTHAVDLSSQLASQYADVAIHCGDLTEGSQIAEFRTSIETLRSINSPLKLVIAGNHDFTMDLPAFQRKVDEATPALAPELVTREYGHPGEVRRMFDAVRDESIVFLDQGTHQFRLANGALLTVYASPWTPSLGAWGFQYHPNTGHDFAIDKNVDVVITHGPPKGIMDYTCAGERAGCPDLFAAVARAKPRIHCFGHIHEGWGAKLVTWKDIPLDDPTHFTAIDNGESSVIENLSGLRRTKFDSDDDYAEKEQKKQKYSRDGCCKAGCSQDDDRPLEHGRQTMFVNAAVLGDEDMPFQFPWLIDIDLPKTN